MYTIQTLVWLLLLVMWPMHNDVRHNGFLLMLAHVPLILTTTPDFQPVMTDAPSVLIPYSLLMSISFDLNSSNNTSVMFSAFTVDVVICTLDKKQVCLTLLCRYYM